MHVEDGYDLNINVEFLDLNSGKSWYENLACCPDRGDTIIIASAPKGTYHKVLDITHHVGCGQHRIVILIKESFSF